MPSGKLAKRRERKRAKRDQTQAIAELERMQMNFVRWVSIPSELETVSSLVPGAIEELESLQDVHQLIKSAADGVSTLIQEMDSLVAYVKSLSALSFKACTSEIKTRAEEAVCIARMADAILTTAEQAVTDFKQARGAKPITTTVYQCAVAHQIAGAAYIKIRTRLRLANRENRLAEVVMKMSKDLWFLHTNALTARALYRMWLQPPCVPPIKTVNMMRELDTMILNMKNWALLDPSPIVVDVEWPLNFASRHFVWYKNAITPISKITLDPAEIVEFYGVPLEEIHAPTHA